MASIARQALESAADWSDIAARAMAWAAEREADARSLIVLVPLRQHLPLARRAWALRGGWQPRIETPRTLAASMAPPPRAVAGQPTLDVSTDRLQAAHLLRSLSWVPRDPLAFDDAVASVVATAHSFVRAAAVVRPELRASYWQRGRERLAVAGGVGSLERALARVALEWAALSPAPTTDALFGLRPSAWVVVQVAGADPWVQSLLDAQPAESAALVLDADALAGSSLVTQMSHTACDDFEHEATFAAARVLDHLSRGQAPVALVAQDRLLVRRVRALLERQGVRLQDETGWKLSTSRAAAQLMSLLRAAASQASADALLDWLKSGAWPESDGAVAEIEVACRREGWAQASAIRADRLGDAARALHAAAVSVLATFTASRRQPLPAWLLVVREALQRCGMWQQLSLDDAGAQMLTALRLDDQHASAGQVMAQTSMSLAEFSAWADGALEDASFVPEPSPDALVVITPLARLVLRPFAAVVFPGADDRHLGVDAQPHPLLSDAQCAALGVPTAAQCREAESLAFLHALSRGTVSFFHRRADEGEPLAPSPLLERLALRLAESGRALSPSTDPSPSVRVAPSPVTMPAPPAPQLLPHRLSASACEALRACPYRFFALHLLRLRQPDELDDEVEQRDYGNWLHAVLLKFHERRSATASPEVECAQLLAIGHEERQLQGLDDASFLPFEAAFADLAPRYVAWLHARDAEGAQWQAGEQDREVAPPEWQGIRLHGRIDRLDRVRGPEGAALELIDYKTGSATSLREKVRNPFEDTQLAFYAALMQPQAGAPLRASYLTLGRKIESIEHDDVESSARALVEGVGHDLARLRSGAGLPALGEPPVCDYCEARGLCRRDHWVAS